MRLLNRKKRKAQEIAYLNPPTQAHVRVMEEHVKKMSKVELDDELEYWRHRARDLAHSLWFVCSIYHRDRGREHGHFGPWAECERPACKRAHILITEVEAKIHGG